MKIRRLLPLLLLLPALVRADAVDDYLKSQMAEKKIPGMAIGIFRDGKLVKAAGYGSTKVEGGSAVTPDTLFNIGSITKQFTATAVLLLERDGKLSVDDPVRKLLPEAPKEWGDMRIRHVLSHTSGLGDYGSVPGFDFLGDPSEEDLVKGLAQTKLQSEPGAKYSYSNIGYAMLGVLIHRASGMPYEEFVNTRILKPAGMVATRFVPKGDWPAGSAVGYVQRGESQVPGPTQRARPSAPAGAILTNVPDMLKWEIAMRNGTVLPKSDLERMWKPFVLNDGTASTYGFGWVIPTGAKGDVVMHTGATVAGFRAVIIRQRATGLTAVLFANFGGDWNPTATLNQAVTLFLKQPPSRATRPTSGRGTRVAPKRRGWSGVPRPLDGRADLKTANTQTGSRKLG
ncbi:MAG: beta-lactamase family protein [Fimbriimonadaceae bacterium]|nr:beta-lactamase family protein [Chthonomonadaceae bacterium]MCO5296457.1 beta-lactamase family protein [Fimbriimonadaceae bacterium]